MISSLLKIHYDKRFIPVARDFVESMAAAAGVSDDSAKRLCLLVEESLSFVMDKYIDSRFDAHIELLFELSEDGVAGLEIMDTGPPIHEHRIPEFDIHDPASESGLWYRLARDMADEFSFENRRKDGWLIRIRKKVETDGSAGAGPAGDDAPGKTPSLSEHTVRQATPEDAAELIDLAYLTYRYSYAADFYDKSLLERAMAEGTCEITVLDNGERIVGAYVIIHPEPGARWAEVGSAMVLPEYRATRAVMYLFRAMGRYLEENPRGCDFFTSHLVTGHARSQKLLSRIKPPFKPLFLFPNMVPSPDFIGIRKGAHERESLLFSFSLAGAFEQDVLYAPGPRHAMLRKLLDNTGFGGAVRLDASSATPQAGETRLCLERNERQGFAVVHLQSMGPDWFTALARQLMALVAQGIVSVCVNVAASVPPPPDLEAQLASVNLIFSGLNMTALDSLNLAYCLAVTPVDFESIRLHDPVAGELAKAMRAEYDALRSA